jgi:cytosine permease
MSLIETEGVDTIAESERNRGFLDLFIIWAGFNIVISNFLIGSLSVGAGLVAGFVATSLSLVLVSAIVYLGTNIAAKEGTAGTTAMRAPFGIQGRVIPSIAMVLATVGWFGVQTGLVASSAEEILANFGFDVPFLLLAAVLGVVMASVAVFGYDWIEWLNRLAVPVMVLLLGLVTYQIFANYSATLGSGSETTMSFWAALNLFPAAMAAFLIVSMDYGRYGDYTDPTKPSLGASAATLFPVVLLAGIGILAASAAGTWNPVQIMIELNLGSVGLLLLILGSWSTNVTNVYAGGIALSQITGMKRVTMTALTGVIGTGLAMGGIFSVGGITSFLSSLTITLVPTTGILLAHYYGFKRGFDADDLFNTGGQYWYLRGWNPTAVLAWAVGAAFAVLAPAWSVPALSSAVVAGGIYYALKSPVDGWIEERTGASQAAD